MNAIELFSGDTQRDQHQQHVEHQDQKSSLEIHNAAMLIAKNLKQSYLQLFEILLIVEARKLYYEFEVPSLHTYCVELLELSTHVAKDFITVVRASAKVPALAAAIRSQKLTVSKARKICPVITDANFKEWIDLATHCSARVVEKAVALEKPKESVIERMNYISGDTLEFKLAVSEEWAELLASTKDLLSQKLQRAVSSEEALFILLTDNRKKNDPVIKAERIEKRLRHKKQNRIGVVAIVEAVSETKAKIITRHRPAQVERAVTLRDRNQCTYIDKLGKRCVSKRWLERHHIRQWANGGRHVP